MDSDTTAADAAADAAANVKPVFGDELSIDAIKKLMLDKSESNDPTDSADGVGSGTILEVDGVDGVGPGFQISLDGVGYVFTTANGSGFATPTSPRK